MGPLNDFFETRKEGQYSVACLKGDIPSCVQQLKQESRYYNGLILHWQKVGKKYEWQKILARDLTYVADLASDAYKKLQKRKNSTVLTSNLNCVSQVVSHIFWKLCAKELPHQYQEMCGWHLYRGYDAYVEACRVDQREPFCDESEFQYACSLPEKGSRERLVCWLRQDPVLSKSVANQFNTMGKIFEKEQQEGKDTVFVILF